jgi:hypothetical protein
LRAAELFFRTQRVTLHDGSLIAADEETIAGGDEALASPLVSMLGLPLDAAIEVLNGNNAGSYWERSDRFDMAIDLSGGRAGLVALAKAMELWVGHLLGIAVTIEPLTELRNAPLSWYVGLDADATQIGNALWQGDELDENAMTRAVGLFRLSFRDPRLMLEKVRGEPIYLMLAMSNEHLIRMKPQNLVTGLPVKHLEAVS